MSQKEFSHKNMAIPGKELVGQNAIVVGEKYLDDYLIALNTLAPVDEIFGDQRRDISQGGRIVGRLVMGTLGRTEWENHLVSIVMTAAKEGKWSAVVREPELHLPGLDEVENRHFGYIIDHKGIKYLLPSLMYVAYCKEKLSR